MAKTPLARLAFTQPSLWIVAVALDKQRESLQKQLDRARTRVHNNRGGLISAVDVLDKQVKDVERELRRVTEAIQTVWGTTETTNGRKRAKKASKRA